jgi:hypothetical protein
MDERAVIAEAFGEDMALEVSPAADHLERPGAVPIAGRPFPPLGGNSRESEGSPIGPCRSARPAPHGGLSVRAFRLRFAIALTPLCLVAAGTGHAHAADLQVTLNPAPAFLSTPTATPTWPPTSFSRTGRNAGYTLLWTDDTSGQFGQVETGTDIGAIVPVTDGHAYTLVLRAHEDQCQATFLGLCTRYGFFIGPDSSPERFQVDRDAPTVTLAVNGGRAFTRTREVTLDLLASDPPSAGGAASGVGSMQIGDGSGLACPNGQGAPSCPQPFQSSVSHRLADGPDGPRTVEVVVRDRAVPGWSHHGDPRALVGNPSAIATATITLDTQPPVPVATVATRVEAGTPTLLDATASTDATSGVDPASVRWDFADGTSVTGATASKTFAQPGANRGTLRMTDLAGNAAAAGFTVTATAPAPSASPISPSAPSIPIPSGATTSSASPARTTAFPIVRVARPLAAAPGKRVTLTIKLRAAARCRVTMTARATTPVRRQTIDGLVGNNQVTMRTPGSGHYRFQVSCGAQTVSWGFRVAAPRVHRAKAGGQEGTRRARQPPP